MLLTFEPFPAGAPSHDSPRPPRVLYAEDDETMRGLVKAFLEADGFCVTTASDGLEAWEILQTEGADVLLTDYRMPGLTGLELAALARKAGMTLPIVIVSGLLSTVAELEHLHLDLAGVLFKPFEPGQLLNIARAALVDRRPSDAFPSHGFQAEASLAENSTACRSER